MAVIVACVLVVTVGAVNCPDGDITPIVLLQVTVLVETPLAVAEQRLFCSDWITVGVQVTEMLVTGVTVRRAVAVLLVSWFAMAVIVTCVLAVTAWAVNNPVESMVPELVPQVTEVM